MSGTFFDKQSVLDGLRIAMQFGAPNNVSDRATFYLPRTSTAPGNTNEDGVPFNPQAHRTFSPLIKKTVPCAVEFESNSGKLENLGVINADRVKITLLDPDYQLMKGAEFVVIAGMQFLYWKTEPVIALGSIDVWTTYWKAQDVY